MNKLKYDDETGRYNGLHCGDCFKIKVNGKWKNVSIESNNKGWYVIDEDDFFCYCNSLEGLEIEL